VSALLSPPGNAADVNMHPKNMLVAAVLHAMHTVVAGHCWFIVSQSIITWNCTHVSSHPEQARGSSPAACLTLPLTPCTPHCRALLAAAGVALLSTGQTQSQSQGQQRGSNNGGSQLALARLTPQEAAATAAAYSFFAVQNNAFYQVRIWQCLQRGVSLKREECSLPGAGVNNKGVVSRMPSRLVVCVSHDYYLDRHPGRAVQHHLFTNVS
jgi:hypothetical protein